MDIGRLRDQVTGQLSQLQGVLGETISSLVQQEKSRAMQAEANLQQTLTQSLTNNVNTINNRIGQLEQSTSGNDE